MLACVTRLLGPTARLREDLRWCEGGQGGRSINGGEQLLGDGLTYGGGAVVDSGECRVEAEGRRLGVGLGHETELLRWLWRAVVWWRGRSTAAQGICSGAEGVAVVLELGNGGYGEDRAQRRAAGAN